MINFSEKTELGSGGGSRVWLRLVAVIALTLLGSLEHTAFGAEGKEPLIFKGLPGVTFSPVTSSNISGKSVSSVQELKSSRGGSPLRATAALSIHFRSADDCVGWTAANGHRFVSVGLLTANVVIAHCKDAEQALSIAIELHKAPQVTAAVPVFEKKIELHSSYAAAPKDRYFSQQWYLEQRSSTGIRRGMDLNVREAWPLSRGAGVTVAVVDSGIDLGHQEFRNQLLPQLHYNFHHGNSDGAPMGDQPVLAHGTAVAGLIAAQSDNAHGMSGVAPQAKLASWVIFDGNVRLANELMLFRLYQHASNTVAVQNHSWGHPGGTQRGVSPLENVSISNAMNQGRGGLGTIMVRSAGNGRKGYDNANDDAYLTHPGVIVVGGARPDGRATWDSNPGASLLVAAGSTETEMNSSFNDERFASIFTTDRRGTSGFNQFNYFEDETLSDYCFDRTGFGGTSASAPQISGIAALILSANSNLTSRQVYQIFALSARHIFQSDLDIQTNGAGFKVSHNVGFGIPDAAEAVRLSQRFPTSSAPLVEVTVPLSSPNPALSGGPPLLSVITGHHATPLIVPFTPANNFPFGRLQSLKKLIPFGLGLTSAPGRLQDAAALITRGETNFITKIENAAASGAKLAIIGNNREETELLLMGRTDFAPIPAVYLSMADAAQVAAAASNVVEEVRIRLPQPLTFQFTNSIRCEQVFLDLNATDSARGDLIVLLRSPAGTVSILQRQNGDTNLGPQQWTYRSTLHFLEQGQGNWELYVLHPTNRSPARILSAQLRVLGENLRADVDRDGLEDGWEEKQFGTLKYAAAEDPDADGFNNAVEQLLNSSPAASDLTLQLDASILKPGYLRLSWPRGGKTNLHLHELEIDGSPVPSTVTPFQPNRHSEAIVPLSGRSRLFKLKEQP